MLDDMFTLRVLRHTADYSSVCSHRELDEGHSPLSIAVLSCVHRRAPHVDRRKTVEQIARLSSFNSFMYTVLFPHKMQRLARERIHFKLRSSGPVSVVRSVECMALSFENEVSEMGTISGTYGGTLQTVFDAEKICSVGRRSKIDGGTLTIVGMKRMRRRRGFLGLAMDCGMYQSLVELGVRQIFTFNVESIALVGCCI